jgi:hypothetical protein
LTLLASPATDIIAYSDVDWLASLTPGGGARGAPARVRAATGGRGSAASYVRIVGVSGTM